jgi:hypothetical protein
MTSRHAAATPRMGRRLRGATVEAERQAAVDIRRKSQRQANADHQAQFAHLLAIADDPLLYPFADRLDAASAHDPRLGGRPRLQPTWAMLVFGQWISILGSASAAARNLADPRLWAMVTDTARALLPEGAAIPATGPTRDHWNYFLKRHLTPNLGALVAGFIDLAAIRARDVGLLDPATRHYARPDRTHTVGIDGTVMTSPLRTLESERVDTRTGEIRTIRQDPARCHYGEAGEEGMAWGTKFAIASTRSAMPGHRVVLGMSHIPHSGGGGEAGAFVRLLLQIAEANPGVGTIVADGAFYGTHIDQLQTRTGVPVVSPPTRRDKKHGGIIIGKYGHGAKHLPASKARDRAFADCPGHILVAAGGAVFEEVLDESGKRIHLEVPRGQVKRNKRANGAYAFYAQHTLECRHGNDTHAWWEPLTPTDDDRKARFNRCEYLRIVPGHHDDYPRVYGMRADTESLNAQLEHAFHKNRLPAWGLERQTIVMLLACFAQNSWARHVWHREAARQQAPPGTAA